MAGIIDIGIVLAPDGDGGFAGLQARHHTVRVYIQFAGLDIAAPYHAFFRSVFRQNCSYKLELLVDIQLKFVHIERDRLYMYGASGGYNRNVTGGSHISRVGRKRGLAYRHARDLGRGLGSHLHLGDAGI